MIRIPANARTFPVNRRTVWRRGVPRCDGRHTVGRRTWLDTLSPITQTAMGVTAANRSVRG